MLQKITQRNTQRLRLLSTTRRNRDTEPLHCLVCKPTDSVGIHSSNPPRNQRLSPSLSQTPHEATSWTRKPKSSALCGFCGIHTKNTPFCWFITVHPLSDNPIASTALAAVSSSTYLQSSLRKVSLLPKCTIKSPKIGDADYLVLVTFHTLKRNFLKIVIKSKVLSFATRKPLLLASGADCSSARGYQE